MRRNDEAHHSSSDDWPAGLEAKALELSREFLRLVDEVRHFFNSLGEVRGKLTTEARRWETSRGKLHPISQARPS